MPDQIQTAPVVAEASADDMFDAWLTEGADPVGNPVVPEVLDGDIEMEGDLSTPAELLSNNYFRLLGAYGGRVYAFCQEYGETVSASTSNVSMHFLMQLAPQRWWASLYPHRDGKGNLTGKASWNDVAEAVIRQCHAIGKWDPAREIYQGVVIDNGHIRVNGQKTNYRGPVFHSGETVFLPGVGSFNITEFHGNFVYLRGPTRQAPDIGSAFTSDAPQLRQMMDIFRNLRWKPQERGMSLLALTGFLAMGVIAGAVPHRVSLIINGAQGAGKSWLMRSIVKPIFGEHCVIPPGNANEPSLRDCLHGKPVPVLFDVVDGQRASDRKRMQAILLLARAACNPGGVNVNLSMSTGKVAGNVSAPFLLTSVPPHLLSEIDGATFATAYLEAGTPERDFHSSIAVPAARLFTRQFAQSFMSRMLLRAMDYPETHRVVVDALLDLRTGESFAATNGALVSGAWLLLREGVPQSRAEVIDFLVEQFEAGLTLLESWRETTNDRDENTVLNTILAHETLIESANGRPRPVTVGTLVRLMLGHQTAEDEDCLVTATDAMRHLKRLGIRPGIGPKLCRSGTPNGIILHRKSPHITKMLSHTPWKTVYGDVIRQATGVELSDPMNFDDTPTIQRGLAIPLKALGIRD